MNTEISPAAALLAEIEALGGKLTVLPDGRLWAENVPESYKPRLMEHHIALVSQLQQSQPVKLTKKELKPLISLIEKAGGKFQANASRTFFTSILLPDQLAYLREFVLENAMDLFPLVFPARKQPGSKPAKCEICSSGSGCRQQGYGHEQVCPECQHVCQVHVLGWDYPDWKTPDGCNGIVWDEDGKPSRCPCPGWPPDAALLKLKKKRADARAKFRLALAAAGQEQEATATLLPTQTQGVKP